MLWAVMPPDASVINLPPIIAPTFLIQRDIFGVNKEEIGVIIRGDKKWESAAKESISAHLLLRLKISNILPPNIFEKN